MKKEWIFVLQGLLLACCSDPQPKNSSLSFRVETAPEWTALVTRDSGWFGGDGIFVIPANGNESGEIPDTTTQMLLFSDTMIGHIKEDSLLPGYHMVNNSIGVLRGKKPDPNNIRYFINRDSAGRSQSLFTPKTAEKVSGEYYWLGDGFVNPASGATHVFAYRVVDRPELELFKFEVLGGVLITIPPGSQYPFADHQQKIVRFGEEQQREDSYGLYGAGVLVNTHAAGATKPDGYIYVYGLKGPGKRLLVTRVLPEDFENTDRWRFWDGEGWSSDAQLAKPVAENVSNELSVSPLVNDKYLLVSQVGGITDATVGIRFGDSPVGPFDSTQVIWDCSDALVEKEFFAYNAKAHPSLSQPGELLISYNVNSFAFWDEIETHPQLYRPRFIRMIFE